MTHYVVTHGPDDIRLHAEDGTEPISQTWTVRPTTNDLADAIAAAGPRRVAVGRRPTPGCVR